MKEELSARRVVMRSALSVCCAQWASVVPPESAAKQAATTGAALPGAPAGGADPVGSTASRKKPLVS